MIRRASRYFDRNPLIAMIAGLLVAFILLYFAAPSLVERVGQSTQRGAT